MIFKTFSGSDGYLYGYQLIAPTSESLPGIKISQILNVSVNNPVVMVALDNNTIAVYGADASEEGAVIFIYNYYFKLLQASQKLKLYSKDAKMWKIDNKLLLATNKNLAVMCYTLPPDRVEARLGSCLHLLDIKEKKVFKNVAQISKEISQLQKQGISNSIIHQQIIPHCLDTENTSLIMWYLNQFNDIPEKFLVQFLSFGLKSINDASDLHILIQQILNNGFTSELILPHLRHLNFDEVIKFSKYLTSYLDDEDNSEKEYEISINYKNIYNWITVLLEANYQKYLLSQDPDVKFLFEKLNSLLEKHVSTK